jgi:putative spermidine/putrescine transport system ATP-binding protein
VHAVGTLAGGDLAHRQRVLDVLGNDDFTVKMRYRANRVVPKPGDTLSIGFAARDCLALDAPH